MERVQKPMMVKWSLKFEKEKVDGVQTKSLNV